MSELEPARQYAESLLQTRQAMNTAPPATGISATIIILILLVLFAVATAVFFKTRGHGK
jgi:flagellar basal body-associated protein FliL